MTREAPNTEQGASQAPTPAAPTAAPDARPARPRWDIGGRDLDVLMREAQHFAGSSPARQAWRRLRRNRTAWWSFLFLCMVLGTSLLAPLLPLPSPVTMDLQTEPQPPVAPWEQLVEGGYQPDYWQLGPIDRALAKVRTLAFRDLQTASWLGTDTKGRDLLSRVVWGSRTSILVALAAAICSLVIGVLYGATAALAGGRVDNLMMRVVDILYSLPVTFVVIFVLSLLNAPRADLSEPLVPRSLVFLLVIGAIYWLSMARVVRGQVLALKHATFLDAARAMGASGARVLLAHVVPNVLPVVIVYLTLTIPSVMLFEAFLSFLGLGIEPPRVSWGLLAADGVDVISPLKSFWWVIFAPAAAMGSTLLALNMLGDGLRDALDTKRGEGSGSR